MLTQTASFRNRAMPTGVIASALEARGQKMARCSADKQWVESSGPQEGREFNSALDDVAGLLAFGLVANEPGVEDAVLQFYVGGTAPGMSDRGWFASDCFPRAPSDEFSWPRAPPQMELAKRCASFRSTSGPSWGSPFRDAWASVLRDGWSAAPSA